MRLDNFVKVMITLLLLFVHVAIMSLPFFSNSFQGCVPMGVGESNKISDTRMTTSTFYDKPEYPTKWFKRTWGLVFKGQQQRRLSSSRCDENILRLCSGDTRIKGKMITGLPATNCIFLLMEQHGNLTRKIELISIKEV